MSSVAEAPASDAKRVLIADDHPLYRDALRAIVPQAFPGACVSEAGSQGEVCALVTSDGPFDLIVLDLHLPGAAGLSCLRQVRAGAPLTPIIVVSATDDPHTMSEVVLAGAAGYVPKAAPRQVLIDALRAIMGGGTYLPAAAVVALRRAQVSERVKQSSIDSRSDQFDRIRISPLMRSASGIHQNASWRSVRCKASVAAARLSPKRPAFARTSARSVRNVV